MTSEGLSTASNMDAVVARMQDLATDKGDALRRSRKDRAKLRSLFRRWARLQNLDPDLSSL